MLRRFSGLERRTLKLIMTKKKKKERNEDEMEKKLKKVIRKRYNSDKSAKMVWGYTIVLTSVWFTEGTQILPCQHLQWFHSKKNFDEHLKDFLCSTKARSSDFLTSD